MIKEGTNARNEDEDEDEDEGGLVPFNVLFPIDMMAENVFYI